MYNLLSFKLFRIYTLYITQTVILCAGLYYKLLKTKMAIATSGQKILSESR